MKTLVCFFFILITNVNSSFEVLAYEKSDNFRKKIQVIKIKDKVIETWNNAVQSVSDLLDKAKLTLAGHRKGYIEPEFLEKIQLLKNKSIEFHKYLEDFISTLEQLPSNKSQGKIEVYNISLDYLDSMIKIIPDKVETLQEANKFISNIDSNIKNLQNFLRDDPLVSNKINELSSIYEEIIQFMENYKQEVIKNYKI